MLWKHSFGKLGTALFLNLLFLLSPCIAGNPEEGNHLNIGEKFSLESKVLNETRDLMVYLPPEYRSGGEKYPVLYLLDGEWHFHHVSGILQFLTWAKKRIKMILVAIPNTHRGRDFSPATWPGYDSYTGGADNFIRFLEMELQPFVEKKYQTSGRNVLCGHSLAGTFCLYSFLSKPEVFDAYIALSPCLFWHDDFMLKKTDLFLKRFDSLEKDLYIAHEYSDGSPKSTMDAFEKKMSGQSPAGLRWTSLFKKGEGHFSYVHKAIYDGLEFVFRN